MEKAWLLPDLDDEDSRPFWEGTARGEILVQECGACARKRMPPRPMCAECGSLENRWVKCSGRGRVWSFVIPHPPLLPAYSEVAPYNVVTVELDDDPAIRLVGNLVASAEAPINSVDPTTIRIGEPVRVVFQKVEDVTLPRWVRETGEER